MVDETAPDPDWEEEEAWLERYTIEHDLMHEPVIASLVPALLALLGHEADEP
jgi:hypothetical protein